MSGNVELVLSTATRMIGNLGRAKSSEIAHAGISGAQGNDAFTAIAGDVMADATSIRELKPSLNGSGEATLQIISKQLDEALHPRVKARYPETEQLRASVQAAILN